MQSSLPTHLAFYKEVNHMDYIKKLKRMDEHLKRHPHDYQTVISRMKVASDVYDHEMQKMTYRRLQRLSEIKKRLREEDEKYGKE